MDTLPERRPDVAEPDREPTDGEEEVDLVALTDAVERLWRRDLEIERERLWGGTRPRQLF
jgi:hypothetical protein